jgi:hypothetical protein
MRQRLYPRLQRLETESARVRSLWDCGNEQAALERARRKVDLFLRICGVVQGEMESKREAFARALGIRPRELDQLMLAGIDPIPKYFVEHGVFEEVERRKAAGTWPSG